MSVRFFGEELAPLPEGFSRVILTPRVRMTIRIDSWVLGEVTIHVGTARQPLQHIAIGLAGERLDKPDHITRWSFTSRYFIDWLWPRLENRSSSDERYTISVEGRAPLKIYHALIEPAGS